MYHTAVNQEVNFYFGENVKPPFLRQYQKSFSEIRDYSSTTTLTQKSKFEENC